MISDEHVWREAYNAAITADHGVAYSTTVADKALAAYKAKFPSTSLTDHNEKDIAYLRVQVEEHLAREKQAEAKCEEVVKKLDKQVATTKKEQELRQKYEDELRVLKRKNPEPGTPAPDPIRLKLQSLNEAPLGSRVRFYVNKHGAYSTGHTDRVWEATVIGACKEDRWSDIVVGFRENEALPNEHWGTGVRGSYTRSVENIKDFPKKHQVYCNLEVEIVPPVAIPEPTKPVAAIHDLKDAKPGDTVLVYLNDANEISRTRTDKTMFATVAGMADSASCKQYWIGRLGWTKGEPIPSGYVAGPFTTSLHNEWKWMGDTARFAHSKVIPSQYGPWECIINPARNLNDAALGATVSVFLDDNGAVSKTRTNRTTTAVLRARSKDGSVSLGWANDLPKDATLTGGWGGAHPSPNDNWRWCSEAEHEGITHYVDLTGAYECIIQPPKQAQTTAAKTEAPPLFQLPHDRELLTEILDKLRELEKGTHPIFAQAAKPEPSKPAALPEPVKQSDKPIVKAGDKVRITEWSNKPVDYVATVLHPKDEGRKAYVGFKKGDAHPEGCHNARLVITRSDGSDVKLPDEMEFWHYAGVNDRMEILPPEPPKATLPAGLLPNAALPGNPFKTGDRVHITTWGGFPVDIRATILRPALNNHAFIGWKEGEPTHNGGPLDEHQRNYYGMDLAAEFSKWHYLGISEKWTILPAEPVKEDVKVEQSKPEDKATQSTENRHAWHNKHPWLKNGDRIHITLFDGQPVDYIALVSKSVSHPDGAWIAFKEGDKRPHDASRKDNKKPWEYCKEVPLDYAWTHYLALDDEWTVLPPLPTEAVKVEPQQPEPEDKADTEPVEDKPVEEGGNGIGTIVGMALATLFGGALASFGEAKQTPIVRVADDTSTETTDEQMTEEKEQMVV
jgi:hypothetical protein